MRVLKVVLLIVLLWAPELQGQALRPGRTARPYGRRPALGGAAGGGMFGRSFAPRREISNPLTRSRFLLRRHGFIGPLRSYMGPSAMPRMIPGMGGSRPATTEAETPIVFTGRTDYADRMARLHRSTQRRMVSDGWVFFHEGDYGRAFSTFAAAEVLNRADLEPLLGQLFSAVAQQHYSRGLHKLARVATMDRLRGGRGPGLFEHDISLWEAFFSEDELRTAFGRLRAFVQANPDVPAVQALYCCVLWYVGTPDAALEAQSVAARIVRTAPRSPWASFEAKIAEAERKKAAKSQAAGTGGAG